MALLYFIALAWNMDTIKFDIRIASIIPFYDNIFILTKGKILTASVCHLSTLNNYFI